MLWLELLVVEQLDGFSSLDNHKQSLPIGELVGLFRDHQTRYRTDEAVVGVLRRKKRLKFSIR